MNGVADSLPSGSGNLDVQLGRHWLPFAHPLQTLESRGCPVKMFVPGNSRRHGTTFLSATEIPVLWVSWSASAACFASNITVTGLFALVLKNANDRFHMV